MHLTISNYATLNHCIFSGSPGKPGVYAEVTSVLEWIIENTDHLDPIIQQPIPDGCIYPGWFGDGVSGSNKNLKHKFQYSFIRPLFNSSVMMQITMLNVNGTTETVAPVQ